jgi:ABC-type amino acid transport substrate-binding protein
MRKVTFLLAMIVFLLMIFVGCSAQKKIKSESSKTQMAQSQKKTSDSSKSYGEKIKIASDYSYKPMEYFENGQMKGFSKDLMEAIGKEIGVEFEFINEKWDVIFDNLYAGKYDLIISSVSITDERKNTMLFSKPYFESKGLVLCKKNNKISGLKDLTGKKVAGQTDTTTLDIISKNIPGVKIFKDVTMDNVFKIFENGSADYIVGDSPIILDYVKTHKDKEYVTVEDNEFYKSESYGIVTNVKSTALISKVNSGLDKIKTNGVYQKIFEKYFK